MKSREDRIKFILEHGSEFPFDASNAWWKEEFAENRPVLPGDWAIVAARGILADLKDRRDIKQPLQIHLIDEDVRVEIVQTLADIIRMAATAELERLNNQVDEFRATLDDMREKAFEREKMIEALKDLVVQGDQLRLKEVAEVDRLRAELEKIKSIIFVTAINVGQDEFGRDGYNAVITFDRETLGYVAEGQAIGKVAEALKGGEG